MRILFMGSPSEVIKPLESLIDICKTSQKHTLLGVVSQCARAAGRKRQLHDPALASYAKQRGLTVWQPEKASSPEFLATLSELKPDLIITAAYGQILSEAFLAIPKRATINIHPSLLPSYRGATPVQTTLLDGLSETGVSILFSVKALDAGAIILQKSTDIKPDENALQLMERLFSIAADSMDEVLELLENPDFKGSEQDIRAVSHCRKIQKEDGRINWEESAQICLRKYRAYSPWPGVFANFGEKRICFEELSEANSEWLNQLNKLPERPGEFVMCSPKKVLIIKTSEGYLACQRLKLQGCKSNDAIAFCNGLKGQKTGYFS